MDIDRREFGRVIGVAVTGFAVGTLPQELAAVDVGTYVVRKGDTLSAIAEKFDANLSELKKLNNLRSIHMIRAGQRLKLSPEAIGLSSFPRKLRWQIGHNKVQRRRWKRIIVHHSATNNGNAAIFHRAHLRRGMQNGLAYHFVIGNGTNGTSDGKLEIGARWERQLQGGHVRNAGLNETSVGICLVGNFEVRSPSEKQLKTLFSLTQFLRSDLLFGHPKVFGHKDLEQNLCPGRNFPLKAFRAKFA